MDYKKVRKHRVAANLSQAVICESLNMSQNSYSLVETGKTTLPLEKYLLLAEILEIKPKELLTEKELDFYYALCGRNSNTNELEIQIQQHEEQIKYMARILEIKDTQIADLKSEIHQLHKEAKKHIDNDKF